ncbi:T9SS type A sorting domain-containing protein [candidate division WOR-3 bacterium]|nr:T9SS type A sorting domain-containing protein [candidate division WOR-3 bacterium]
MLPIKGRCACILCLFLLASMSKAEVALCNQGGALEYNIEIPEYEIEALETGEIRILMDASTHALPGYPRVPVLTYTFALPPGTEVTDIEVLGDRTELDGEYLVEARKPLQPLSADKDMIRELNALYEENRTRVYSGQERLPDLLGKIHRTAEQREYSLVTVAVYPFHHDPSMRKLTLASEVTIRIHYAPVSGERTAYTSKFLECGTLYSDIPEQVYNKEEARQWYRPQERLTDSPGMVILTIDEFKPYLEDYISWRESTGFRVRVVTKEDILASSVEGVDLQQKIRNWLRANATDYHYLFIVAHHWDIPMRILHAHGYDGSSQNPYYYPHPTDIYYGDLSKPDDLSWDANQDGYYGQIDSYQSYRSYQADPAYFDNPDLEMELHVGRMNAFVPKYLADFFNRIKVFESSKDMNYKKRSVLAGGILFYYSDTDKYDGAYIMESLMEYGVLERSMATTLYEKQGDSPSEFDCDRGFTNPELVAALAGQDIGVFVEFNHGSPSRFVRTVWYDDNEDGYPEDSELDNEIGLEGSDCPNLNSTNPNTAFLLSCLCGSPDLGYPLAQKLLDYSSVGVVAHTRVAWGGGWFEPGDGGLEGLFYNDLEAYLKESTYDYVIGDAVSEGRARYWRSEGGWGCYNAYGHVLYGDPALRHYGREKVAVSEKHPLAIPLDLTVDVNQRISFSLSGSTHVRLEVWDVTGRKLETLFSSNLEAGQHLLEWNAVGYASGTYFITLKSPDANLTTKAIVIR